MFTNMNETKPPNSLLIATLLFFIFIISFGCIFTKMHLPDSIEVNAKGQPTIGFTKAKVHVVVFEEPKCINCRQFHEKVFPQIKKEFIDSNKITYTTIPVSFLQGSMPAATALLCVYYEDPLYPNSDLFFSYLDYMYAHQPQESADWATRENLEEFAKKASPAISINKLGSCIDHQTYRSKIVQNTEYGKKIMGGTISTPTVYVNGIVVRELTFDNISDLIEKVQQSGGKS